jgi:hypothetical protein
MDIMLSDESGWSELINGIEFNHPLRIQSSVEWWEWVLWSPPILVDIMLSNGGGCFEFPNPSGYHVEWWEWLIWTQKWNWIQPPPTNPKFCCVMGVGALNPQPWWISCWVMGVGAMNSPILVDIVLSNESGCSELPKPNGYHVEWWEWLIWTHKWNWIQSPPTSSKFCWVMGVGALSPQP